MSKPTPTNHKAVCTAIIAAISGVQHQKHPGDRLAGLAGALILACRHHQMDLSELLNQADRAIWEARNYSPHQLRAAQDYVRFEL